MTFMLMLFIINKSVAFAIKNNNYQTRRVSYYMLSLIIDVRIPSQGPQILLSLPAPQLVIRHWLPMSFEQL